jgi:hypothetical protein
VVALGHRDDGWYVDGITVYGAINDPQIAPELELTTFGSAQSCPATAADNCNQALGTNGFIVDFTLANADNDGTIALGEQITLDASQTLNPGGCADGVPQFKFTKVNGATTTILQDWSTDASVQYSEQVNGDNFKVQVRCSSDFSCQTLATGPPEAAAGCIPPGLRFAGAAAPPSSGNSPWMASPAASQNAPFPFTIWEFGTTACGARGAAGALLCATTHNWEHGIDPAAPPVQTCHAQLPMARANVYITTGAMPLVPITVATLWGPFDAAAFGAAVGEVCSVPFGAAVPFNPNTCDITPMPGTSLVGGVCVGGASPAGTPCTVAGDCVAPDTCSVTAPPAPPVLDVTCGDSAIPAVNTYVLYATGYSTTVGGAACTSPAGAPWGGPPPVAAANVDLPGPYGCYRFDDDTVTPVGPAAAFAPPFIPGSGCP